MNDLCDEELEPIIAEHPACFHCWNGFTQSEWESPDLRHDVTIDGETFPVHALCCERSSQCTGYTVCPECGSEDISITNYKPSPANNGFDGSSTKCNECDWEEVA